MGMSLALLMIEELEGKLSGTTTFSDRVYLENQIRKLKEQVSEADRHVKNPVGMV